MLIGIIIFGVVLYIIYFNDNNRTKSSEDEILRCYNCGHILEENYNYCPNCKERLKKQCEGCGKSIGVNWRHCPYCNHPNEVEGVEK